MTAAPKASPKTTPRPAASSAADKAELEVLDGTKPALNPLGPPAEFCVVAKGDLSIDLRYQRGPAKMSAIRRMAREWDWRLCGTLDAYRDGSKLLVFDGGQRLTAANMRPDITDLPCMVCTSPPDISAVLRLQDQANLFIQKNEDRVRVSAQHHHRAAVTAGRQDACVVEAIINKYGFTSFHQIDEVDKRTETAPIRVFDGLASLYWCVRQEKVLAERVFGALAELVSQGEVFHTRVLKGLFFLTLKNRDRTDVLDEEGKKRLQAAGMRGLAAAVERERQIHNTATPRICALAIMAIVNKGRTRGKVHLD